MPVVLQHQRTGRGVRYVRQDLAMGGRPDQLGVVMNHDSVVEDRNVGRTDEPLPLTSDTASSIISSAPFSLMNFFFGFFQHLF